MIQKYLKDMLSAEMPALEWTIETYTGKDDTGTVLLSSPRSSDVSDERGFIFPAYQVYLRSSDKALVEFFATKTHELLNKRRDEVAVREYRDKNGRLLGTRSYNVIFIECDPPIRIGMEGKHLDYSINLRTILKEATQYATS